MNWTALFDLLITEANLAPSVHNVQPALWKISGNSIELYVNKKCLVPAADPENRDIEISLGTAIEGLSIASLSHGYEIDVDYKGLESEPVASITARKTNAQPDPLTDYVQTRHCFRGKFEAPSQAQINELIENFENHQCARVLVDSKQIQESSNLYEKANLGFYQSTGFLEELNDWLRFSTRHDRYSHDGLNRASMALDPVTSWAASVVLKPKVFRFLDKLGLAGSLITEAPQILSSTGILFFIRNTNNSHYVTGRKLYRMWLEVERAGFAVCPLSSLTDNEETRSEISKYLNLESHQEATLAFRCGPKPKAAHKRARKPLNEIRANL